MKPQTEQMVRYKAYLRSPTWEKQRESAFARWGRFCNYCGKQSAHPDVHHLFYRKLYDCIPQDLMPLCRSCHSHLHTGYLPYYVNIEADHTVKRQRTIDAIAKNRKLALVLTTEDRDRIIPVLKDSNPLWQHVLFSHLTTVELQNYLDSGQPPDPYLVSVKHRQKPKTKDHVPNLYSALFS